MVQLSPASSTVKVPIVKVLHASVDSVLGVLSNSRLELPLHGSCQTLWFDTNMIILRGGAKPESLTSLVNLFSD